MGAWKEDARDRSADSTLMYSLGELTKDNQHKTHAYLQIWQYDPRVANWGLRVLLINPLPLPKEKILMPSIQRSVVRLVSGE